MASGRPIFNWWLAAIWLLLVGLVGFLMVSTWRFWSGKEINLSRRHPVRWIVLLGLVIYLLVFFSRGLLLVVGACLYVFRHRGAGGLRATAPEGNAGGGPDFLFKFGGTMTEKYKIAIVGAASIRGKELNEALGDSVFSSAEVVLIDDESQAGQLEAAGDEATLIQRIDDGSFAHVDFAFFAGTQEMTRSHWKKALSAGASIVDLSSALEDTPGVLVRAPWLLDESTTVHQEDLTLSTPAIIPAHPVAVALRSDHDAVRGAKRGSLCFDDSARAGFGVRTCGNR